MTLRWLRGALLDPDATVLAYAASYFARGFAGHHRFGLYGGLVLMEATSRRLFALAVIVGVAEGQTAVALGMVAAPLVSLAVAPRAIGPRLRRMPSVPDDPADPEAEAQSGLVATARGAASWSRCC